MFFFVDAIRLLIPCFARYQPSGVVLGHVWRQDPIHDIITKYPAINYKLYAGEDALDETSSPNGITINLSAGIAQGTAADERVGNNIVVKRIDLAMSVQNRTEATSETCRFALVQLLGQDTAATPLVWADVFETTASFDECHGLRRASTMNLVRVLWDSGPIVLAGSPVDVAENAALENGDTEVSAHTATALLRTADSGFSAETTVSGTPTTGALTTLVPSIYAGTPTAAAWTATQAAGTGDMTTAWTDADRVTTLSAGSVPIQYPTYHTFYEANIAGGQTNRFVTPVTTQIVQTTFDCHLKTQYSTNPSVTRPTRGGIYLIGKQTKHATPFDNGCNAKYQIRLWWTNANTHQR